MNKKIEKAVDKLLGESRFLSEQGNQTFYGILHFFARFNTERYRIRITAPDIKRALVVLILYWDLNENTWEGVWKRARSGEAFSVGTIDTSDENSFVDKVISNFDGIEIGDTWATYYPEEFQGAVATSQKEAIAKFFSLQDEGEGEDEW